MLTPAEWRLFQEFLDDLESVEVRDLQTFAEEELILPFDGGPHAGEHFTTETQPWTRLLFAEIDHGRWTELIMTAPSQCGKTLILFVLMVLYVAYELKRNVVIGLPDEEMWGDKWSIDLKPVIEASPTLREALIPKRGTGSKAGKVKEAVELANGIVLKPMTPSGHESTRSGFTASHVVVTELYKFDGDPLQELIARQGATSAFTDDGELSSDRRLYGEGTLTTKHELPWTARTSDQRESGAISTESEIYDPCPHCGEFSVWERQHLKGWQSAGDSLAAAKTARFCCPKCDREITEEQRRESCQHGVLVHRGQTVDKRGVVSGDPPPVARLFFRVNGFNNLFRRSADLGMEEWNALQTEPDSPERAAMEKYLGTKVWCVPYEPQQFEEAPLQRRAIRARQSVWPENVLPPDTKWFTVGVDVGRWQIWYFALVARVTGELCVPFADCMDTSITEAGAVTEGHEHTAILNALRKMADRLEAGFPGIGASDRQPDQVWIDSNYHRSTNAVWQICKERGSGVKGPWMPLIGFGRSSQFEARKYTAPTKTSNEVRVIDPVGRYDIRYIRAKRGFRVHLDADTSKIQIQAALKTPVGQPGSLVLWDAPEKRHTTVSRHLAAEVYKRYLHPTKGMVEEWVKSGQNHLLDAGGYALCALWRMGFGVESPKPSRAARVVVETPAAEVATVGSWWAGK